MSITPCAAKLPGIPADECSRCASKSTPLYIPKHRCEACGHLCRIDSQGRCRQDDAPGLITESHTADEVALHRSLSKKPRRRPWAASEHSQTIGRADSGINDPDLRFVLRRSTQLAKELSR